MTFDDLFTYKRMPCVDHPALGFGRVTVIKDKADGSNFRGCAVRFDNMNYDVWFHDSTDTDKRSKYLRELTITTMPMVKIDKKAPSFSDQKCSFCGWKRKDHDSYGACYHYSDQDTDYFYKDKFFQP